MHPSWYTMPFGKFSHVHKVYKDGVHVLTYNMKPLPFACIPPDSHAKQLLYPGLQDHTRRQIEEYLTFLSSDPGSLFWPIRDKSGHYGQRLEEIYDTDPGYLEWFVNTPWPSRVLKPLVVDYMKYREALVGGFSVPEISDSKDFSVLEQMTGRVLQHEEPFHIISDFSGSVHISETFRFKTVQIKKPSAWFVSNPHKADDELLRTTATPYYWIDWKGVSKMDRLLYVPPQSEVYYHSDFYFVSMYQETFDSPYNQKENLTKHKKPKWISRLKKDEEQKVFLYHQFLFLLDKLEYTEEELVSLTCKKIGKILMELKGLGVKVSSLIQETDDIRWQVRMKHLRPSSTYYDDSFEPDYSFSEEEVELSPADEYAVREGLVELEDLIPETEDLPVEFVEEGHEIYYETEEEMDFLGEYRDGNYIMHGDRKFLEDNK